MKKIYLQQLLIGSVIVSGLILIFLSQAVDSRSLSYTPKIDSLMSNVPIAAQTGEENLVRAGVPVRITIPKISVNAKVIKVGLTENGAMAAPKSLYEVGWFSLGARPGEKGSAVLAGHYGRKPGIVFNNLRKLKPGDYIFVEDEMGINRKFIVRDSRLYARTAGAAEVFAAANKAYLKLVTCEGAWIPKEKTYENRRVIFADLVQ